MGTESKSAVEAVGFPLANHIHVTQDFVLTYLGLAYQSCRHCPRKVTPHRLLLLYIEFLRSDQCKAYIIRQQADEKKSEHRSSSIKIRAPTARLDLPTNKSTTMWDDGEKGLILPNKNCGYPASTMRLKHGEVLYEMHVGHLSVP